MSARYTQTDSKALHAIWCLSNSQLNSGNLKRVMPGISCELSEKKKKKTVKSGTKCVLNPSLRGVHEDVRSTGGLSQAHTVIQMARKLRLVHKQVL